MIRFKVLASGSKGNAIIVTVDGVNILLDAGITHKALTSKLSGMLRSTKEINAVCYSHNHGDHIKAIPMILKKKANTPIYGPDYLNVEHGVTIDLFGASVTPIAMEHDTECFGYIVEDKAGNKLGYVTDTGGIPCDTLSLLLDCNALIVEFNHDISMYDQCKYPEEVKQRAYDTHLENRQARDLIALLAWKGLRFVVCHHISQSNNNPSIIRYEAGKAVQDIENCQVIIAEQDAPTAMMTLI